MSSCFSCKSYKHYFAMPFWTKQWLLPTFHHIIINTIQAVLIVPYLPVLIIAMLNISTPCLHGQYSAFDNYKHYFGVTAYADLLALPVLENKQCFRVLYMAVPPCFDNKKNSVLVLYMEPCLHAFVL